MATFTVFRSNGVGQPISIVATPVKWSRVSSELLRDLVAMEPPSILYTKGQLAAARRELNRRQEEA